MSESNEYAMDKSGLPPGPWMDEPDKLVWVDTATNLDCMIVRGPLGSLCGYVGVDSEHPNHGKTYWTDEGGLDVDVHGGITYANKCEGTVCHVPEPGRTADIWWFGFDCAHYMDVVPRMKSMGMETGTYKDIGYVRREVTDLARQLKELADE